MGANESSPSPITVVDVVSLTRSLSALSTAIAQRGVKGCVQNIYARNILCPLRKSGSNYERSDEEPSWVGYDDNIQPKARIWNSTYYGGACSPVVVASGAKTDDPGQRAQIEIEVTKELAEFGRYSFLIECGDYKALSRYPTKLPSNDVLMVVNPFESPNVPGGIRGPVKWSLYLEGYSVPLVLGTLDMEIYWLPFSSPSQLPPYLRSSGCPVTLFRMFVPNAQTRSILSEQQDWIEHVVKIVHGIRKPITFETQDSSKHWLKYDVNDGAPQYCGPHGDGFALDEWIYDYHRWNNAEGGYSHVNCYDQAGATEIVLSLGYPYQWIAWEYHQVYGFIKAASLVGRGLCNNPYFGDDNSLKITSNLDPRRSPFRNHAFLSIGRLPEGNFFAANPNPVEFDKKASSLGCPRRLIIDACAGPVCGNVDRVTYMSNATETDPSRADLKRLKGSPALEDPGRWSEVHTWEPGITGTKDEAHTKEFKDHPNYAPGLQEISNLKVGYGKIALDQMTVHNIFKNAIAGKKSSFDVDDSAGYDCPQPTITIERGITRYFVQAWLRGNTERSYKSLTIEQCADGQTPIDRLKARARWLTPPDGVVRAKSPKEAPALSGVPGTKVWGGAMLNMFVLENLFVQEQHLHSYVYGIAITKEIIVALQKLVRK